MEGYSLRNSPEWTRSVFGRARALGLSAFKPAPGPAVLDDHVPFLRQGIDSVDLIDFDYPQWHTHADDLDACSPASLHQVGRLLLSLIYDGLGY
jgi:Zn-dependent M28 family amino/carboxypeptidase